MTTYTYNVAELYFTLTIPSHLDVDALLPSMKGFRVDRCDAEPMFQAQCVESETLVSSSSKPLEQTTNDMGRVSIEENENEYTISVSYFNSTYVHYLILAKDFRNVKLQMQWQDKAVGHSLNSLLRIAFAQAVILQDGI